MENLLFSLKARMCDFILSQCVLYGMLLEKFAVFCCTDLICNILIAKLVCVKGAAKSVVQGCTFFPLSLLSTFCGFYNCLKTSIAP